MTTGLSTEEVRSTLEDAAKMIKRKDTTGFERAAMLFNTLGTIKREGRYILLGNTYYALKEGIKELPLYEHAGLEPIRKEVSDIISKASKLTLMLASYVEGGLLTKFEKETFQAAGKLNTLFLDIEEVKKHLKKIIPKK